MGEAYIIFQACLNHCPIKETIMLDRGVIGKDVKDYNVGHDPCYMPSHRFLDCVKTAGGDASKCKEKYNEIVECCSKHDKMISPICISMPKWKQMMDQIVNK